VVYTYMIGYTLRTMTWRTTTTTTTSKTQELAPPLLYSYANETSASITWKRGGP
jgi:hypothetical protein